MLRVDLRVRRYGALPSAEKIDRAHVVECAHFAQIPNHIAPLRKALELRQERRRPLARGGKLVHIPRTPCDHALLRAGAVKR